MAKEIRRGVFESRRSDSKKSRTRSKSNHHNNNNDRHNNDQDSGGPDMANNRVKRGEVITQEEIERRREEQAEATRFDQGDIGKETKREKRQRKHREELERIAELEAESAAEEAEAEALGVSLESLRDFKDAQREEASKPKRPFYFEIDPVTGERRQLGQDLEKIAAQEALSQQEAATIGEAAAAGETQVAITRTNDSEQPTQADEFAASPTDSILAEADAMNDSLSASPVDSIVAEAQSPDVAAGITGPIIDEARELGAGRDAGQDVFSEPVIDPVTGEVIEPAKRLVPVGRGEFMALEDWEQLTTGQKRLIRQIGVTEFNKRQNINFGVRANEAVQQATGVFEDAPVDVAAGPSVGTPGIAGPAVGDVGVGGVDIGSAGIGNADIGDTFAFEPADPELSAQFVTPVEDLTAEAEPSVREDEPRGLIPRMLARIRRLEEQAKERTGFNRAESAPTPSDLPTPTATPTPQPTQGRPGEGIPRGPIPTRDSALPPLFATPEPAPPPVLATPEPAEPVSPQPQRLQGPALESEPTPEAGVSVPPIIVTPVPTPGASVPETETGPTPTRAPTPITTPVTIEAATPEGVSAPSVTPTPTAAPGQVFATPVPAATPTPTPGGPVPTPALTVTPAPTGTQPPPATPGGLAPETQPTPQPSAVAQPKAETTPVAAGVPTGTPTPEPTPEPPQVFATPEAVPPQTFATPEAAAPFSPQAETLPPPPFPPGQTIDLQDAANFIVGFSPIGTVQDIGELRRNFGQLSATEKLLGVGAVALSVVGDVSIVAGPGIKLATKSLKGGRIVQSAVVESADEAAGLLKATTSAGKAADVVIKEPVSAIDLDKAVKLVDDITQNPELASGVGAIRISVPASERGVENLIRADDALPQTGGISSKIQGEIVVERVLSEGDAAAIAEQLQRAGVNEINIRSIVREGNFASERDIQDLAKFLAGERKTPEAANEIAAGLREFMSQDPKDIRAATKALERELKSRGIKVEKVENVITPGAAAQPASEGNLAREIVLEPPAPTFGGRGGVAVLPDTPAMRISSALERRASPGIEVGGKFIPVPGGGGAGGAPRASAPMQVEATAPSQASDFEIGPQPAPPPVQAQPVVTQPAPTPTPAEIQQPAPAPAPTTPGQPAPAAVPQPEPASEPTIVEIVQPAPPEVSLPSSESLAFEIRQPEPLSGPALSPAITSSPGPAPEPEPAPQPTPGPQPEPQPQPQPQPAPAPTPPPAPPKAPPGKPIERTRSLRLPLPGIDLDAGGEASPQQPRIVGFRVGEDEPTVVLKDLVTGREQRFVDPPLGIVPDEPGTTPEESFRVISRSERRSRTWPVTEDGEKVGSVGPDGVKIDRPAEPKPLLEPPRLDIPVVEEDFRTITTPILEEAAAIEAAEAFAERRPRPRRPRGRNPFKTGF